MCVCVWLFAAILSRFFPFTIRVCLFAQTQIDAISKSVSLFSIPLIPFRLIHSFVRSFVRSPRSNYAHLWEIVHYTFINCAFESQALALPSYGCENQFLEYTIRESCKLFAFNLNTNLKYVHADFQIYMANVHSAWFVIFAGIKRIGMMELLLLLTTIFTGSVALCECAVYNWWYKFKVNLIRVLSNYFSYFVSNNFWRLFQFFQNGQEYNGEMRFYEIQWKNTFTFITFMVHNFGMKNNLSWNSQGCMCTNSSVFNCKFSVHTHQIFPCISLSIPI